MEQGLIGPAAAGIVHHAVLMGLPASAAADEWMPIRRLVAGRLINCFRRDDLVLSLVYRASSFELRGVAGLSAVACSGVENFDVGGIVCAHHKYRHCVGEILRFVGIGEGT